MKKSTMRSAHKITVLCELLANELDEAQNKSELGKKVIQKARELQQALDHIVDDIYTIEGVRKSTYLIKLGHAVDTTIRKFEITPQK